ncbi:SDR family NAD(P)-dependent oxidoreductase [Schumannella soli]|uniref:Glucose 1-dehydrogenase n=1 Tax=Schumannella soli TaxID=2590779 RepID=A0A506Y6B3_9MICO|nr:glucose 1-dehydrogenase [Schumannella soli]TPW77555.1 glucose 1-dehydrogenase [Schumannella soli]
MTDTASRPGLLAGKSVLIVGASAGIGADSARVFAREGARVMLAARSRDALERLADEVRQTGGEAEIVAGDVGVAADVERFVAETVARWGRIDGAFNNAGVNQIGRLDEIAEEDFDRVMTVNVKGVWLCLREQVRAMRRQGGGGSIVNTASIGGLRGSTGLGVYPAAKHAVVGLTRVAAHDNGPVGIRVNAVAPGATATPMLEKWRLDDPEAVERRIAAIPLRKPATPSEVGETAAWLLSDRASQISGVIVPVDGGFTA